MLAQHFDRVMQAIAQRLDQVRSSLLFLPHLPTYLSTRLSTLTHARTSLFPSPVTCSY